ncbi:MAG: hypothetical protein A3I49_02750 [Candidatus Levybacteria bacterium RIFCSPLOWO2_02_FULL_37_11]|nr:MAG: hypothetical protein A3I49_02750 [Candidatus Levybacteria bacterium RIFCSPLOWO2_02_FULL_37_11]
MATSKSSRATSMAELMSRSSSNFKTFKKSEIAEGVITKLTSGEILVDIGAKAEAQVLEKDKSILRSILSSLKVGDKVVVSVLNPESDMGFPVVSLRRFIGDIFWKNLDTLLKDKKVLDVLVTEATRGGFLVETIDGKQGFLPNSHAVFSGSSESLVGAKIKAAIVDLDRASNKLIFSQKATIDPEQFGKLTKNLKVGESFDALVNSVTPFGIFVSFQKDGQNYDGFVHISEVSWERKENLEEEYNSGDTIKVTLLSVDKDAKRINLSIKRLGADPFEKKAEQFNPDKKVVAKISQISDAGIRLFLEDGVEGFIKKEKIPLNLKYSVDQEIEVSVSQIDKKNHRIIVTPVLKEKPIGYR